MIADGDDVDLVLVGGAEDGVGLEADLADDGRIVEMGVGATPLAVSVARSASDCNDSPSSPYSVRRSTAGHHRAHSDADRGGGDHHRVASDVHQHVLGIVAEQVVGAA